MNAAIRRYVLDDERIVLATRRHWARLLEPTFTAAAALVGVWLLVGAARPALGGRADLLWWLWVAVMARTALRFVAWHTEWFVATDKRMLLLTGIVTHRVAMMPLLKVTDMSYARSVLGRVLGYGEFVLESAGQDQAMRRIGFVPDPDRSYRTLCGTIFAPGAPSAPRSSAPRSSAPGPSELPPVIRPLAAPARPVPSPVPVELAPRVPAVPVTQAIEVVTGADDWSDDGLDDGLDDWSDDGLDDWSDDGGGAAGGSSDPERPGHGT